MINIVKRRYLYFGISLLVIVPGVIALILWGLPTAIDFSGGSLLEVTCSSGTLPHPAQVVALYEENGFPDSLVQTSGTSSLIIRSKSMDESIRAEIMKVMEKRFNTPVVMQRFENVGPSVGQEVALRAAGAVGLAAIGILLYISFAFRAR